MSAGAGGKSLELKIKFICAHQRHVTVPLAREILLKVRCALVEELPDVVVKTFREDETNIDLWALAEKAPQVIDQIYNLLQARLATLNSPA
jgi:hypothetical protein